MALRPLGDRYDQQDSGPEDRQHLYQRQANRQLLPDHRAEDHHLEGINETWGVANTMRPLVTFWAEIIFNEAIFGSKEIASCRSKATAVTRTLPQAGPGEGRAVQ